MLQWIKEARFYRSKSVVSPAEKIISLKDALQGEKNSFKHICSNVTQYFIVPLNIKYHALVK
jgi:hypothetical protein